MNPHWLSRDAGIHRLGRVPVGVLVGSVLFAAGWSVTPSPVRGTASTPEPVRVAAVANVPIGPLVPQQTDRHTPIDQAERNPSMPPVETYQRVLDRIESDYYKRPQSTREMTYAAIRGLLGSLGDRYTRFLDPDEFRRMQQDNQGEFGGIGAKLEKDHGRTIIKEVVPKSPAESAGVKPGDAILTVDGKPMAGVSILKVVDAIRGQKGTPVKIGFERKGLPQPIVKSIVRDTIKLPTVVAKMVFDANKRPTGIAHVELTQFNELAHSELDSAMQRMQRQGMRGLILDLRGNPGGLLTEAVEVGSRFVDRGPIVFIERNGQRHAMMSRQSVPKWRGPLVVLVNKLSASASEIVSGAIKDTNSGLLVGTDTWGKGLVQTITPIREDGSAVLITTHRYLTPNLIDINKKGIAPHVKVALTRADAEKKLDPQLNKAVSILEGDLTHATASRH